MGQIEALCRMFFKKSEAEWKKSRTFASVFGEAAVYREKSPRECFTVIL